MKGSTDMGTFMYNAEVDIEIDCEEALESIKNEWGMDRLVENLIYLDEDEFKQALPSEYGNSDIEDVVKRVGIPTVINACIERTVDGTLDAIKNELSPEKIRDLFDIDTELNALDPDYVVDWLVTRPAMVDAVIQKADLLDLLMRVMKRVVEESIKAKE